MRDFELGERSTHNVATPTREPRTNWAGNREEPPLRWYHKEGCYYEGGSGDYGRELRGARFGRECAGKVQGWNRVDGAGDTGAVIIV